MRSLLSIFALLFIAVQVNAAPIIITAPTDHLFIPKGFDNNDNVEVFVSGKFPNSCYSRNKVEVSVKNEKIDVKVTALLEDRPASECEKIEIPYIENVTIGSLQAGDYQVSVNNTLNEKIAISEANSSSVDDHLYAMVDYVELGFTGGVTGDVFLVGRSTDCVVLDHVELISNGNDTLSVLPIMKKVSHVCSQQRTHFNIPVSFNPKDLNYGKILLFVRTMDGKSVNALIEK